MPQPSIVASDEADPVDGDVYGEEDDSVWATLAPGLAGVTGAVVLASGVWLRVRRNRRHQLIRSAGAVVVPSAAVTATERGVLAAADVPLVRWAGQSLAALAVSLDPSSTGGAPVAAELSSEAGIELLWDAPQPNAPTPWTAADGGWAWRLAYDPDAAVPPDTLPCPLPALVTIGRRDSRQLLVNLEAFGVLAVAGDADRVDGFIRSLVMELGAGEELADAYVTVIGTDAPALLDRVETADADHARRRVEAVATSVTTALDTAGLAHSFSYRCGPNGAHLEATVVVASAGDIAGLVAAARPHRGIAVITTIDSVPASTGARVVIEADGTAVLEPLGVSFVANDMPAATAADVDTLLADAATDPAQRPSADVSAGSPVHGQLPMNLDIADFAEPTAWTPNRHVVANGLLPVDKRVDQDPVDDALACAAESGSSPLDASLVVKVLGTPRVPDRPNLKRREVILTAFLACRGGQVNASAVQDALWNGQAVQGKTVWNLVGKTRAALGLLPDGTWALPPSDRHRRMKGLAPGVTTDLAILRHLHEQAQTVSSSEAIELLRQALALVEGPPFDADGFDWAHHGTQDVAAACGLIARAVEQLVGLALDIDDVDRARDAITAGLRGLPGDEVLYRLRMRTEHHAGNLPGVTAAYEEVVRYLREFDSDPSPATLELHRTLAARTRA